MADTRITSMNQIKRGIFVKFVDRDKNGKFSYTGEVISLELGKEAKVGMKQKTVMEGAGFTMRTMEGVMGFDMSDPKADDANELYVTTTKPAGWSKFIKDPKEYRQAQKEKNAVVLPTKTKRELVVELVAANPRKKESALLKLAKKEIGGNETQLSNYIKLALAKK